MTAQAFRPLAGALGAELTGVSVGDLAPAAIAAALLRHQLLVLRDQRLSPTALEGLAASIGEPEVYPYAEPLAGSDYVVAITKEPDERHNFGGAWHSDTSYLARPPAATLLYAVEVPEGRGDTLFADMYAAYDSLSDGLKLCLEKLSGCNSAALVHDPRGVHASVAGNRQADDETPVARARHPVVRVHPGTGRRALYLSLVHTERFAGMTREESLPLLGYLQALAVRAENTSRLCWRPGTLAIWDNRCVQHLPLNDYHGARREMHRVILRGEAPVGVSGEA